MKTSGKCPKCEGAEIVRNVNVVRTGKGCDSVQLSIDGDPNALVFTDTHSSDIEAFVCAACGFTELYAADAAVLALGQRTAERNAESR